MLVPTADNVLTDKLPANAAYYDQEALLAYVEEQIGESHYIDVFSVLKEHSQEESIIAQIITGPAWEHAI